MVLVVTYASPSFTKRVTCSYTFNICKHVVDKVSSVFICSAAIVTTSSISAATTSVVAALTSTRPSIRADGALQPSHPLSPTLGFICTALTGIKSSLDELRKEQSSLKKEFNEFVISSFSIESSAYKVTN